MRAPSQIQPPSAVVALVRLGDHHAEQGEMAIGKVSRKLVLGPIIGPVAGSGAGSRRRADRCSTVRPY